VDAVEVDLHVRLLEVVVDFLPERDLGRVQPALALVDLDQLGEDGLDFVQGSARDLREFRVFPVLNLRVRKDSFLSQKLDLNLKKNRR
jgi:hypothetical protein